MKIERSIELIRSSNCGTDYRVKIGALTVDVHAWAITGGTLAMTLSDNYFYTQRFNYCPERDTWSEEWSEYIPGSGKPEGKFLGRSDSWKKWNGVDIQHFTNAEEDFFNYAIKASHQREIQLERTELIGPPRFSGRFHDTANCCYFSAEWNCRVDWNTNKSHNSPLVSPVTGQSKYYGGRISNEIKTYASPKWAEACRYIEETCADILHNKLYELTAEQFERYRHVSTLLKDEPTVKLYDFGA